MKNLQDQRISANSVDSLCTTNVGLSLEINFASAILLKAENIRRKHIS